MHSYVYGFLWQIDRISFWGSGGDEHWSGMDLKVYLILSAMCVFVHGVPTYIIYENIQNI